MNHKHVFPCSELSPIKRAALERKLTAYLAASAGVSVLAAEAQADVVSNSTVQPFGINEAVLIDFNSDGQGDFEIDHDRVDLGGGNHVDYLQIDKNDVTGAGPGENPLAIPNTLETFPLNGKDANDTWEAAHVIPVQQGDYPSALLAGAEIGPLAMFDFQEGNGFQGSKTIRANRLIDEDAGQVDMELGGLTAEQVHVPTNGPNFVGLGGQVRYLGVKMDFENTNNIHYGWIGIHITNDADATGEVVGWGYENQPGVSILAGATAPTLDGDFNLDGKVDAADYAYWRKNINTEPKYLEWRQHFGEPPAGVGGGAGAGFQAVPEPTSLLLALTAGVAMIGTFLYRRIARS